MFPEPHFVDTNGIRMAVYERGEGPAVIFLHGFPELAFSWRHQLPAVADAGYRAIAVDQRGYGRTTVPEQVEDYGMQQLIGDVTGLLDALQLESATFVGHDWGALLLWTMAMLDSSRIDRLIGMSIPHMPRPQRDPIEIFRERLGDDFYIVDFQRSDEADRQFASDPAHFFEMLMRRNQIRREQFEQLPPAMKSLSLKATMAREVSAGEPLLSDEERDYIAAAFVRTGFTGAINWYRNWTSNWRLTENVDQQIDVPTLFIGAVDDVVIPPDAVDRMKPLVPDLEIHMLEPCGHWIQQERPDDVNRLMIDWLRRRAV